MPSINGLSKRMKFKQSDQNSVKTADVPVFIFKMLLFTHTIRKLHLLPHIITHIYFKSLISKKHYGGQEMSHISLENMLQNIFGHLSCDVYLVSSCWGLDNSTLEM